MGSEAYAGHDLIQFLGIEGVPGAIEGGVQGSNVLDGIRTLLTIAFGDGVFEYAGATLNVSDIEEDGNFLRIDHPTLGDIPVGITNFYALRLVDAL